MTLSRIALAAVVVWMASCREAKDYATVVKNGIAHPFCENQDAVDMLALEAMQKRIEASLNGLEVWLSHNYDVNEWEPRFKAQRSKLDSIGKWAETQPPCIAKSYKEWVWFYGRELDEAIDELHNQGIRKEMKAYDRENDDRRKRESSMKIPEPSK